MTGTLARPTVTDLSATFEQMRTLNRERDQLLAGTTDLWLDHCAPCTQVHDAIEAGALDAHTRKTTRNPICEQCPVHHQLQAQGRAIEENLRAMRNLRQRG